MTTPFDPSLPPRAPLLESSPATEPERWVQVDRGVALEAELASKDQDQATRLRGLFLREARRAETLVEANDRAQARKNAQKLAAALKDVLSRADERSMLSKAHRAQEYRQTHRDNPGADAFAQGALFGFGDELVGAAGGPKARERFEASMKNYRLSNPVAAYASELAGGAAAGGPIGGLAGGAVQGTRLAPAAGFVAGAVPGMLQGAGNAEPDGRLSGALVGGAVGGGLGMGVPWAANRVMSPAAARLPASSTALQQGRALAGDVLETQNAVRPGSIAADVFSESVDDAAARLAPPAGAPPRVVAAFKRGVATQIEEAITDGAIENTDEGLAQLRQVIASAFPDEREGAAVLKAAQLMLKEGGRKSGGRVRRAAVAAMSAPTMRAGARNAVAEMGRDPALARSVVRPPLAGATLSGIAGTQGPALPLMGHLFHEDE